MRPFPHDRLRWLIVFVIVVDDDIVGVIGIFFLQMGDYFVADGVVVGLKAYDQIEVDGRGFLVYVEAVHLQDRRSLFARASRSACRGAKAPVVLAA